MKHLKLVISLLILTFAISQYQEDPDVTKALSCMSLVNKKMQKNSSQDPHIYSAMMLKCFISIKESQTKEIVKFLQQGREPDFSESEINKLTDSSDLQSYDQQELVKNSEKLGKAIEKFKKLQEKGGLRTHGYDDDDFDDRVDPNIGGNAIGLFAKGLNYLLATANSFGGMVLILVGLFFGIRILKNLCNKIEGTEKPKKKNKNKNKEKEY